jgi:hypothetical protein
MYTPLLNQINLEILISYNLCNSVKSKYCITEQCSNKPKNNEKLCGKHLNSKNIIYFKNDLEKQIEDIDINNLDCEEEDEKKKIYNKAELYDIISNKALWSISILFIKKLFLVGSRLNTLTHFVYP